MEPLRCALSERLSEISRAMNSAALARTSRPCDDHGQPRERRQRGGVARTGAIHRVGERHGLAAPLAVAPPSSICRAAHSGDRRRGRSCTRSAHRTRGFLRHGRLERVIAPADQQPPVDIAHVTTDAAAAGGIGRVERVAQRASNGRLAAGSTDGTSDVVWHCARKQSPVRPCVMFTFSENSFRDPCAT